MKFIFVVLCIFAAVYAVAADFRVLQQQLAEATNDVDGTVGIALISDAGDTVTVNDEHHYPLMSVMKLHQAIYIAHYLHENGLDIDHTINVRENDLKPDTYSPLRDSFPQGAAISVGQLLKYTLQLSDNNACDILFDISGGPKATDSYIRSCGGLHDFAITVTEDDMHRDTSLCHANYTTPLEAARLISKLCNGQFGDTPGLQFVKSTLAGCLTGTERIPKGVGDTKATILHKTGTSDCDSHGKWTAINDVAHVTLPDGTSYSLAVFAKDSYGSYAEIEHAIARISAIVYAHMAAQCAP